ncbi:MAG: beta-ketoacyl synthase chain length factor [Thermodesulfobacteriota bacterium]
MSFAVYGLGAAGGFGGSLAELAEARPGCEAQPPDLGLLAGRVPPAALRRMDGFTRMSLLAALRCREDAVARGVADGDLAGERVALVLATGYGPMRTTFDYLDSVLGSGEPGASPTAFSLSVQNMPAAILALSLGVSGSCCTACQLDNPVLPALVTAACWLAEGRADTVLVGAADESSPMLDYGLGRLRAAGRAGLPGQGNGAAFLCLRRPGSPGRAYAECTGLYASEAPDIWTGAVLERGGGQGLPGFGESPVAWAADVVLACWVLDGGEFESLSGRPGAVECRCSNPGPIQCAVRLRRPTGREEEGCAS